MAGFFGGLAEGLGQGIQFASQQRARELQQQHEAAYEANQQSLEKRRLEQTDATLRNQSRQQQLDSYKALHDRINELGGQFANAAPTPEALDEMKTLREQERALTGQLFPGAATAHTDARQLATDMASGTAQPKAEDVYNLLSQATGRPANELVSADGKPTPTQLALNDFTQGMQNLQADHGQQALKGLNSLYGDELHGYVGHALPGGGTVAAAEFAPPVPMQGGGMSPVIKLTSDSGAVRYVPLLSDQQSPEGQDLVHTVGLDRVLNHVNALQTVTHMVNADPKLKQIAQSGNPDKAREVLDARRVSTAPAKQSMFMSPDELSQLQAQRAQAGFPAAKTTTYVNKDGDLLGYGLGGPGGVHEIGGNPRQAQLDAAELEVKQRQLATMGLREVSGVDAEGKPVLGTLDVTKGQFTPASGIAPAPKGAAGAAGMSGREAIYAQRVITAGQNATKTLENISTLPVETTSGMLTSGAKADSLMSVSSNILSREMSSEASQRYASMVTGLGRLANTIEGAGLPGTAGLASKIEDSIKSQPGDTLGTKMQKLAQARQDVEEGLTAFRDNPRIAPEQKDQINELVRRIESAIPYTVRDTIKFSSEKPKGVTFQKWLAQNGKLPAENMEGWSLHKDSSGNFAYVSPDGKTFKEVK